MLVLLKENGYPMNLWIESADAEDEKEEWKGYESIVTTDDNKIIAEFKHDELRGRILWTEGFFAALKMIKQDRPIIKIPFSDVEVYSRKLKKEWEGKDDLYDKNGYLENISVGDWVITNSGLIREIWCDDQPELPYQTIKRYATTEEMRHADEINKLQKELNAKKAFNKSGWDTYGSELCAGEMIKRKKN